MITKRWGKFANIETKSIAERMTELLNIILQSLWLRDSWTAHPT